MSRHRALYRARFLAGFAALTAAGTSLRSTRAAEQYTMRFSVSTPPDGGLTITALRYAAAIKRRTNDQLKIEVYANGQLSKQEESLDGLRSGVIDLTILAAAFLVPQFPRFQVFDAPFLFKDLPTSYRVLDGPIGSEFLAAPESKGIAGLAWGNVGYRVVATTNKSIVSPADMKGLRIRIQASSIYPAVYQALGSVPVTIDISEVFVAMQQHAIDGVDVTLDTNVSQKFYTIAPHTALTNHVLAVTPFLGNKRKIESLPASLQGIIRDEAKALRGSWRTSYEQQAIASVDFLKKNGVAVTNIQYAAFRKVMDPVYALLQSKVGGDLFDRLRRATS